MLKLNGLGESMPNSFSLATFVYIFNKDLNKILLIKRNKEKREKWGFDWGIVGGKVEIGEYSFEAAIREVYEETKIKLSKDDLQLVGYQERPSRIHTPAVHFFYFAVISEGSKVIINGESDEFGWFNVENLPDRFIEKPEKVLSILSEAKKMPNNKNE